MDWMDDLIEVFRRLLLEVLCMELVKTVEKRVY